MEKIAYFAGGCFWCITPIFKMHGANKVVCGYCGGDEENPTYEDVKHQLTKHRETIAIYYDDAELSYDKLLEIYLANVDPYDSEGQFIDKGYSYTLAIYYNDDEEKQKAFKAIKDIENKTNKKAFIQIEQYKTFYKAEEYHQDYYLKNPKEFEKELIESGRKKEKKMKNIIGSRTNAYKGFTSKETFSGIKKAGYKYIEISGTPNNNSGIDRFKSFSELCEAKKYLEELGITPIAMSGHTSIMDKDIYADFINNLELTKFFGCKYFDSNVGSSVILDDQEIADRIKPYIPYLEKNDLYIVLEIHEAYCTGKQLKRICELTGSNRVLINYDTANTIFFGGIKNTDELIEDIKACVDRIGMMHIKDKIDGERVWNFPALGKGYIPFKEILKILEDNHNECPLVVEVEFTKEGVNSVEEVDQAMKDSFDYLTSI